MKYFDGMGKEVTDEVITVQDVQDIQSKLEERDTEIKILKSEIKRLKKKIPKETQ